MKAPKLSSLFLLQWQPPCQSPTRMPSCAAPDGVVDDDGIGMLQQPCQLHRDLGESHADAVEDLARNKPEHWQRLGQGIL